MAAVTANFVAIQAALAIQTDTTPAAGAVGVILGGTFVGTVVFESTNDGTNWFGINAFPVVAGLVTGVSVASATAAGQWVVPVLGFAQVRVRCSAYTSGTITAAIDASTESPFALPVVPFADSTSTSGQVTAPGATTTIATQTPGVAGVYEVRIAVSFVGGTPAAADGGNMSLKRGVTALVILANLPVPVSATIPPAQIVIPRLTMGATDTIVVASIGAGTAGVIYHASITMTRVG